MTQLARVVFLLDVDNTLVDNDRLTADLKRQLGVCRMHVVIPERILPGIDVLHETHSTQMAANRNVDIRSVAARKSTVANHNARGHEPRLPRGIHTQAGGAPYAACRPPTRSLAPGGLVRGLSSMVKPPSSGYASSFRKTNRRTPSLSTCKRRPCFTSCFSMAA